MNIVKLISTFQNISADNKLSITIGKSISNRSFNINNKIFFDILKTYLNKNNWYVSKQFLSKRYYYEDKYLQSTIEKKDSILLGLDIPAEHNIQLNIVDSERFKQYKGTYFDIFCHQVSIKPQDDLDEFITKPSKVYSEIVEEVSIMKNHSCNTEIIFNVNKSKEHLVFSVSVSISNINSLETKNIEDLFDILELAMCKYKKTDKKQTSVFEEK